MKDIYIQISTHLENYVSFLCFQCLSDFILPLFLKLAKQNKNDINKHYDDDNKKN
jgi:hypothetical protein